MIRFDEKVDEDDELVGIYSDKVEVLISIYDSAKETVKTGEVCLWLLC